MRGERMENRKKMLIAFVIFIAILAAFIFYDPSMTRHENTEASAGSTEARLSEKDDDERKAAWYYASSDTQEVLYAEFWISGDDTYSYHTYEGKPGEKDSAKDSEVTGKCERKGDKLFYWVDGEKEEGTFKDGNLIIEDRIFLPLSSENSF